MTATEATISNDCRGYASMGLCVAYKKTGCTTDDPVDPELCEQLALSFAEQNNGTPLPFLDTAGNCPCFNVDDLVATFGSEEFGGLAQCTWTERDGLFSGASIVTGERSATTYADVSIRSCGASCVVGDPNGFDAKSTVSDPELEAEDFLGCFEVVKTYCEDVCGTGYQEREIRAGLLVKGCNYYPPVE